MPMETPISRSIESMIPETTLLDGWLERLLVVMAHSIDVLENKAVEANQLESIKAIEDRLTDLEATVSLYGHCHPLGVALTPTHRPPKPPATDVPSTVTRPWMRDASEWRETALHKALVELLDSRKSLLFSGDVSDGIFYLLRQEPTSA